MNNHPFRFGDSRGTPTSDAKGGCCGKPIGCRIESKGCLHHAKKAKWQQEALDEMDRNARAYGWEIGRGKPMTRQMEMSPDNPFIQEDWKKNMVEPDDLPMATDGDSPPTTLCEPYIQQDGYDSGLTLVCDRHDTKEPIVETIEGDNFQVYHISLRDFITLSAAHQDSHKEN